MNIPSKITTAAKRIKLLLLDVDGVLTDGRLYYGNSGEEMKAFNIQDGLGIKLLQQGNVQVGIITGRVSALLQRAGAVAQAARLPDVPPGTIPPPLSFLRLLLTASTLPLSFALNFQRSFASGVPRRVASPDGREPRQPRVQPSEGLPLPFDPGEHLAPPNGAERVHGAEGSSSAHPGQHAGTQSLSV